MTATTSIKTPAEIRFPASVKDYGLQIVHDMHGNERNLLHEVGVRASDESMRSLLFDGGYRESYGFRREDEQWWVMLKDYPMSVLEWVATPDYRD